MEEVWKDIHGYENVYQVSSLGNIRSLFFNWHSKSKSMCRTKTMKQYIDSSGYCVVNLYNGKGQRKRTLVHRLVAEAFIPNADNKPFVDHIDTNQINNKVDNLRWVTAKENSNNPKTKVNHKRACKNCRVPSYGLVKAHLACCKPVLMVDKKEGIILRTFQSVTEAALKMGLNIQAISNTCNGRQRTSGGFIWKYKQ